MSLDPYAFCSCGSGKKFKWCCQNIYGDIRHAFQQDEEGQHEVALKRMEALTQQHATNPEVWGRYAELLYKNGRAEEAEATLEKAFEINPNYPYGLLLQAQFRYHEGEHTGALLLARRAAEAYHPSALDFLALVYGMIFELEMGRHNPVAARSALSIMIHCQPGEAQFRESMEGLFGSASRLPECARHEYTFLSPSASIDPVRRQAWDQVLGDGLTPRLGALAEAFTTLTQQDENDAAAWFNLGLVQGWLGQNQKAIESLERYLALETDDARASRAAALSEVLRCGEGMEDLSDYREFRVEYQIRDPQVLLATLQDMANNQRLVQVPTQQEGTLAAMIFQPTTSGVLTAGATGPRLACLAGYLLIFGAQMRLWSPLQDALNQLRQEFSERVALGIHQVHESISHIQFADVLAPALSLPVGENPAEGTKRVLEHAKHYLEDTWVHRPLRSLGGLTPTDAATQPGARRKLLGLIQFMQDCSALGIIKEYNFDQLRARLGLAPGAQPAPSAVAASAPGAALDVESLDAAGLAALNCDTLSEEQLERAYQSALRLNAEEVSDRFAQALLARPPQQDRPDRFPFINALIQRALQQGKHDEAIHLVNEGTRLDCEHNQGHRRNDYELRRGQIHVRRGEPEEAYNVFTSLIQRVPDNLKFRGSALEGLLSLKQGGRAVQLGEESLKVARQQQNRDAEQHFMELIAAARKLPQ